jgi:UDP-N-acetylmuramate dehydrogenase
VSLAPLTTFGVGGPARWFVEASTEAAVSAALAWAREQSIPVLVLGGGSNLLVADRGVEALVLRVRVAGITAERRGDAMHVEAGAGERWDDLVARAVTEGWAGIECLAGIPGDVGATPIQNVGAYGQDVSETIASVRTIERASGKLVEMSAAACAFGYRDSVFKRAAKGLLVVTRVTFALRPGGAPGVRYPELAKQLAAHGSPSLSEVRAAVLALRKNKSMLLDPDAENGKSAGSFFMNPTLDAAELARVTARVASSGVLGAGETMPAYPASEGRTKLAAGWLIERAGFHKGSGTGRVGLSTKHALAIVNRGGATAAEIVAFARTVKEGVRARFGVELHAEPVLVGFNAEETAGLVADG